MSPVYDLGKQQSFDNANYADNDSDIDIDDDDDENNYNYKLNNKNSNSNHNSNSNPNSSSNGSSSGTPMKKQKEKKKKKKYNLGIVLGNGRGRGGRSGRGLGLGLGRGFGRGSGTPNGKNGTNNNGNNNSNRSNNHNNTSNNSTQMIRRGNPYPYHNTAHSDGNSNDNENTKYDEEQAILNKYNSSSDSSDNNDESYVESYIESDASESPSAEEAHIKAIQIQQVKTMTNNIQIQKLQDIQNQEIELINAVSDVIYHNDESVAVSEIHSLSDEEDEMGYGYGNISGHSLSQSSLGYSIERSNFQRGGHHNDLMSDSDDDGDGSYHHTGTPNKYNRNTAAIAAAATSASASASNNAKDEILSDSDISIDEEYALTNAGGPNRSRNRRRNRNRNRSRSNGNGNDYDSDDECDNVQNRGLLNLIQSDDGSNNTNDNKDDENIFNLQQDIFTILFISPFMSISFLYAFVIYSFQMSILCLAVVSLLRDTPDGNPWDIPLFITWDVRLAQFLALMVSVFTARDIIQVLDIFQIQYSENIKDVFPKAHLYKWYLSALLRLAEGVLSLFVAFCFIIQSTDVLDLFLDFAVVQFVGELNDVGFYLAEKGYSTKDITLMIKKAKEIQFKRIKFVNFCCRKPGSGLGLGLESELEINTRTNAGINPSTSTRTRKSMSTSQAQKIMFALTLTLSISAWMYFQIRLTSGYYFATVCQRFEIKFDDYRLDYFQKTCNDNNANCPSEWITRTHPIYYTSFNDVYEAQRDPDDTVYLHNYRPVYHQRGREGKNAFGNDSPSGKFSYCTEEKAWVFTIDGVNKGEVDQKDEGCNWLMKSVETEANSLHEVETDGWIVWTGILHVVQDFSISCIECQGEESDGVVVGCTYHGICSNEKCECEMNWMGDQCEACVSCNELVYNSTDLDGSGLSYLRKLNGSDGVPLNLYGRPVYYKVDGFGKIDPLLEVLLYDGRRYVVWDLKESIDVDEEAEYKDFLLTFLTKFHSTWDFVEGTAVKLSSETTDDPMPSGLKWAGGIEEFDEDNFYDINLKCRVESENEACRFAFN